MSDINNPSQEKNDLTAGCQSISTDQYVEPLKGMVGRSFISIDELR
jgi:hypothetical protein